MLAEVQKKRYKDVHYNADVFTKKLVTLLTMFNKNCLSYGIFKQKEFSSHYEE